MSDSKNALATLSKRNGYLHATFTRSFTHGQQTVWNLLTNPQRYGEWLAPGAIELKTGGAVKLTFPGSGTVIDSIVSAYEPPRLIEYSWSSPGQPNRPVRWVLAAKDGGTQITLTVSVSDAEDIARTCAGWEAHLAMLQAALAGAPIPFPFELFKSTRETYKGKTADLVYRSSRVYRNPNTSNIS